MVALAVTVALAVKLFWPCNGPGCDSCFGSVMPLAVMVALAVMVDLAL